MKIMKEHRIVCENEQFANMVVRAAKRAGLFAWCEVVVDNGQVERTVVFKADPLRFKMFRANLGHEFYSEKVEEL